MTHWLSKAFLVLASLTYLCPLAVHAQAVEDRVAFIIGNGGYPKSLALKNPLNDATAIEKQLSNLGFETKSYKDLKVAEVSGLRQQMESRLKRNSVLFFYYAGHGVQIDGRNYLLPVDATLNDGDKASQESLFLGDVLHAIERMRPKIAVVILDACRDNPFKDQKNSSAAKQGLARVDPPTSTVVFYATRPGGTAQDGDDENGVFTKALLQEIVKPEQPLEVLFRRVSTAVYKNTRGEQEPWIEGVIREEFAVARGVQSAKPSELKPEPLGTVAVITQPTVPAPLPVTPPPLTQSETLAMLSDDDVKARVRSIKTDLEESLPTRVICDESGCFDYTKWVGELGKSERLESLKESLKNITAQPNAKFCIFDLNRFDCPNQDPIKMSIIYPLAPILPSKVMEGFSWQDVKVTNSGGVAFKYKPLVDRKNVPGGCIESDGAMQFTRTRIDMTLSRMTCFNLIVPGSVKQNLQILMMDLSKREMLAYWDWNVISFLTYGSGRHLVKIRF
jgi:hypothetical protein